MLLDNQNNFASGSQEPLGPNQSPESPQNPGDSFEDGKTLDWENMSNWDRAKLIATRKAKQKAMQPVVKKLGQQALGDKAAFLDPRETNRERVKELAKEKARNFAKDKIGKKIGNEGIKKGLEKGLEKGASKLAKEGAKKLGKEAGKQAAKAGTKLATKAGAQLGTKGLQTIISGGAVASAPETLGLGLILGFLLNVAISLGVNDAVDALFELSAGNLKKAKFLATRAGARVGMFVVFLLVILTCFAFPYGLIAGPIQLLFINIYMIMGWIFKNNGALQGLVWWEQAIILVVDVMFFILFITFAVAVMYWVCLESGLGGGAISGFLAKTVDWWYGTNYVSVVNDMCVSFRAYLPK